MANRSGRYGTEWENACLEALLPLFPYVYRRGKQGAKDKGDFGHTGDFCIEAKNTKVINLPGFLREATVEAEHAGARWPVVFIKQRGKASANNGYAVMHIDKFLELISAHSHPAKHISLEGD